MDSATQLAVQASTVQVEPVTGNIGAEISGVDIRRPLEQVDIDFISAALVQHKVLFFRDQPADIETFHRFALQFGDPEPYPLAAMGNLVHAEGYPDVAVLEATKTTVSRADSWHSDMTFKKDPSYGSILRCVVAPAIGGDTMWANMEAAFEGLDDATQSLLSGLTALHDWYNQIPGARARGVTEATIAELQALYPPMVHPVVRTHPVSGRKVIYVNPAFTRQIVGMKEDESQALLRRLFALTGIPEYQVRLRWKKDSIAFWDNRSTQHYGVLDYFGQCRRVERVTFIGDDVF